MKKIFAILFAAILVLGFAASAFAIHAEIPSETQAVVAGGGTQITLGGELRVRGWYEKNIDNAFGTFAPVNTNSESWYDERVRLSLDAKVSPNVEGFVQLESNGGSHDTWTWGSEAGLNNSKPTDLNILQAWIMYSGTGLLGVPAGVKIGHMPLALGEMQFFDHTKFGDDAIVLFAAPTKEMEVALLTVKFQEGAITDNNDDVDGYVGLVTYKWDDKNTIGLNYTYLNSPDGQRSVAFEGLSLQDISLHANGNISGLGYNFEFDDQFGDVQGNALPTIHAKGWAVMAKLNYGIDMWNLRGMFAYGSGDKNPNDNDVNEFITFLGHDQHHTFVYDYQLQTASAVGNLNEGVGRDTGLSNTTYYNLGFDVKPVKDVKFSLDGYILRASKTDDFVNTQNPGSGVSKSIGWEIDASVAYNIAKNLTYEVDGGYLKAGDFYKDTLNAPGVNVVKNPVVLMHKITLSF